MERIFNFETKISLSTSVFIFSAISQIKKKKILMNFGHKNIET